MNGYCPKYVLNKIRHFQQTLPHAKHNSMCSGFSYGFSTVFVATLAYNCGHVSFGGDKNEPGSLLIQKIKRGEKDTENEYLTPHDDTHFLYLWNLKRS